MWSELTTPAEAICATTADGSSLGSSGSCCSSTASAPSGKGWGGACCTFSHLGRLCSSMYSSFSLKSSCFITMTSCSLLVTTLLSWRMTTSPSILRVATLLGYCSLIREEGWRYLARTLTTASLPSTFFRRVMKMLRKSCALTKIFARCASSHQVREGNI